MNDVMIVSEHFLLSLAFAMSLFSIIASSKLTGAGFIKLSTSVAGGSALLALACHLRYASLQSPQAIFLSVYLVASVLIYAFHRDGKNIAMWILWLIQVLSALWAVVVFHNTNTEQIIWALSSAGLLGIVTYAMVLGHWYLVVPKLSEKPLVIATIVLWIIMVLKIGWTGIEVSENADFFTPDTTKGAGYSFNMILLIMRAAWGYLVVGIMSIFSWRLIRMRSIQSATGMLYAMTFFVLVGELMAQYMFFKYGVLF
ncbi:MAG: hypothetical protein COW01_06435 [Bdellovibrionales bacterium CG12_big_fil_rev_8_21_14_0_65_38_15]|nr:MAG: hypothetical protein COW79_10515 [Bdellovibrionales bacterium CG22_combo_CG10-13_8_21_14_all_38_13]PIQ55826.1 MAG: hypothetical protein COW01_06435 [Bdellovibrionales bacterium CG12_big_fil_rev_8_21_14_0_65_38_15]PIR28729.1 MAG: hypothetical protein COV38_14415 [Bdellovibrionales bacterium CG11_big_fil_rev_8_21_14_0_20_38_13]